METCQIVRGEVTAIRDIQKSYFRSLGGCLKHPVKKNFIAPVPILLIN
jgi:hypothetical protein